MGSRPSVARNASPPATKPEKKAPARESTAAGKEREVVRVQMKSDLRGAIQRAYRREQPAVRRVFERTQSQGQPALWMPTSMRVDPAPTQVVSRRARGVEVDPAYVDATGSPGSGRRSMRKLGGSLLGISVSSLNPMFSASSGLHTVGGAQSMSSDRGMASEPGGLSWVEGEVSLVGSRKLSSDRGFTAMSNSMSGSADSNTLFIVHTDSDGTPQSQTISCLPMLRDPLDASMLDTSDHFADASANDHSELSRGSILPVPPLDPAESACAIRRIRTLSRSDSASDVTRIAPTPPTGQGPTTRRRLMVQTAVRPAMLSPHPPSP